MRRVLAALAVAAALAVGCEAGVPPSIADGKAGEDGIALAKQACERFKNFREMVRANAKTTTVLEELEGSIQQAQLARDTDRFWQPLVAGMTKVKRGFEKNDPDTTEEGREQVDERCLRARQRA